MGNRLEADATAGVESWTLSGERCVVRACIALLIAWSVFFVQTVHAGPTKTKTILVLGDSLSQGFGLAPSEAYPMLLAKKLRAAGLNFQVTNASAAGQKVLAEAVWHVLEPIAREVAVIPSATEGPHR